MNNPMSFIASLLLSVLFVAGVIVTPAFAQEQANSDTPNLRTKTLPDTDQAFDVELNFSVGGHLSRIAQFDANGTYPITDSSRTGSKSTNREIDNSSKEYLYDVCTEDLDADLGGTCGPFGSPVLQNLNTTKN